MDQPKLFAHNSEMKTTRITITLLKAKQGFGQGIPNRLKLSNMVHKVPSKISKVNK